MRKIVLFFVVISLAVISAGCVTSGMKKIRGQRVPIALVSVVANSEIHWKDENPIDVDRMGPLAARVMRNDPGLVLVSRTEEFINVTENLIRETLANSSVTNLADRETVLQSRAYQAAKINREHEKQSSFNPLGDGFSSIHMVKPEDFRFVDYRDRNFASALAAETGIQRSMFVEFNFTRAMALGIGKYGTCRPEIDMTVQILDASGKRLFRKTYSVQSISTTNVSAAVYSDVAFMRLLESAVVDALYQLIETLEG